LGGGCSTVPNTQTLNKNVTEQDVRNVITELISGINSGNIEIVQKYVEGAGPVAEKLIKKLHNNIRLTNIRDISIQGTTAQATVTLEIIPLKIQKDVALHFNITDVLLLNSPLGLLSLLL
jgi:hypothetical protein